MADLDAQAPHLDRSVSAMGERVARVETKIEGIEKDTGVIRSTLHGINGEMQKFVMQEARCITALEMISERTKDLPEIVMKVHEIYELKPKVQLLHEESAARKGAWGAYVLVGTAATGAVAIIGSIGATAFWLLGKLVAAH